MRPYSDTELDAMRVDVESDRVERKQSFAGKASCLMHGTVRPAPMGPAELNLAAAEQRNRLRQSSASYCTNLVRYNTAH